jgi:hypothetical protein
MIYTDPSGHSPIIDDDPYGNPIVDRTTSGGITYSWDFIKNITNLGNQGTGSTGSSGSSTSGSEDNKIAGVCGSGATNCISPVGDDKTVITHFEELDVIGAEYGYDIVPVLYSGDKRAQAKVISDLSPNKLICYSAGVDSCLLYANGYDNPENLQIVLIGGGYVLEDGSIGMDYGSESGFENGFVGAMNDLAQKGAHFLVIYDGNMYDTRDYITTGGNIQAVETHEYHYDVDEPSSSIWPHVFAWFKNPSFEYPTNNYWAR